MHCEAAKTHLALELDVAEAISRPLKKWAFAGWLSPSSFYKGQLMLRSAVFTGCAPVLPCLRAISSRSEDTAADCGPEAAAGLWRAAHQLAHAHQVIGGDHQERIKTDTFGATMFGLA